MQCHHGLIWPSEALQKILVRCSVPQGYHFQAIVPFSFRDFIQRPHQLSI